MLRMVYLSLLAVALGSFNSGCCCCRLPFLARGIVVQPPPVVVGNFGPPPQAVPKPPRIPAVLPPIDVVNDGRARFYLSDLKEVNPRVGFGQFGKNGRLGYGIGGVLDSPITVAGRQFPKAISTAPPHFGMAAVQYALGKQFRDFRAWIAVNDLTDTDRTGPESALTFKVAGDGKTLWTSEPVRQMETVQECRADVRGVETLELQVHCPGVMHCARAVWLQPHLLK